MKLIFNEYAKLIIAAIAGVGIMAIIFSPIIKDKIVDYVEGQDNNIKSSQGADAMKFVQNRTAPLFAERDNTQLYRNQAFQPLSMVSAFDEEGSTCAVVINSIVLSVYSQGKIESYNLTKNYNAENDIIILNHSHYTDEHKICSPEEYDSLFKIIDEKNYNEIGYVKVEYKATDSYGKSAVETVTYTINSNVLK